MQTHSTYVHARICRIVLGAAVALLITASGNNASAQTPSVDELVRQGLELRTAGRHAEALEVFERAFEIEPAPRVIAQIGLAHIALNHWLLAYEKITEALRSATDPWIRTRHDRLFAALEVARPHLAFIRITGGQHGVHAFIGGRDAGALPLLEPVVSDAGRVDVRLEVHGRTVASERVTAPPGATLDVAMPTTWEVSPAPITRREEPIAPRPLATPHPQPQHSNALAWTLMIVGGAALSNGVVFSVLRENAAAAAISCNDSGAIDCYNEHSADANTYTPISIASYAVGGALVLTSVLLFVLHSEDEAPTTAFACSPSIGSFGATCAGSF